VVIDMYVSFREEYQMKIWFPKEDLH